MTTDTQTPEERDQENAAYNAVNVTYWELCERVHQASIDGYEIKTSPVLATAWWHVGDNQRHAGDITTLERLELFKSDYESVLQAINKAFPRK